MLDCGHCGSHRDGHRNGHHDVDGAGYLGLAVQISCYLLSRLYEDRDDLLSVPFVARV